VSYVLVPDAAAVKIPSVFVCFAAVLVPPLREHFIAKPALREWDLTKASPEERRLARQQNLAAGWSDWFGAPTTGAAGVAAE
jgi:hypothetical protein